MLDERLKAFVFRNNVKCGVGALSGETPYVVRYAEIQGVSPRALDGDILGLRTKCLQLVRNIEWDLALVGAAKDPYLKRSAAQRGKIFWLNVLEVQEDEACFHGPLFG